MSTFTHLLASSLRRAARTGASLLAVTALVLAMLTGITPVARAADAASISASISYDGTAPFDADNGPGNDSDPANGIVRSMDRIGYQLSVTPAAVGVVTIRAVAPAGLQWQPESLAGFDGSIDGATLTINLDAQGTAPIMFTVVAKALAVANGTELPVTFTSGAVHSDTLSVTTSAAPMLRTISYGEQQHRGVVAAEGTPYEGQLINRFVTTYGLYLPLDATKGAFGLESLSDPITLTVAKPTVGSGWEVEQCSAAQAGTADYYPKASGGGTNAAVDSGTWTCVDNGDTVTVTITGMDSSLSSYPTKNANGTNRSNAAWIGTGQITWQLPLAGVEDGAKASFPVTVVDPVSSSGVPITSANQSTASFILSAPVEYTNSVIIQGQVRWPSGQWGSTGGAGLMLPGRVVTPTWQLSTQNVMEHELTGLHSCMLWDNSLLHYVEGRAVGVSDDLAGWTIEYGTGAYTTEAELQTADCGTVGDGAAGWYSSPAEVPGGASAITGVRVAQTVALPASTISKVSYAPPLQMASSDLPLGTYLPVYTQFGADQIPFQQSSYVVATNGNTGSGARVAVNHASVDSSVAWDVSQTQSFGELRTISSAHKLGPVGYGTVAQDVTHTVKLPAGVTLQSGSSQWNGEPITPEYTANADGTTTLVYRLGDIAVDSAAAQAPVTLSVTLDPAMAQPTTLTVTAKATSVSDGAGASTAGVTSVLSVNVPQSIQVSKTTNVTSTTAGTPVTYTVSWGNRTSDDMADSSFVDLLPFDGDARGTTGLGGLVLNAVTVVSDTSAATVQYTTDAPESVQAALVADVTGGTGITWTTGTPPADSTEVTALRFVPSVPFTTGAIGKAEITLTPTALDYGGRLVNSVDGSVDGWAVDLRNAASVTLDSSASQVVGNVYNDPDFAFARTENSTGVASPVVRIVAGYAFGPDGDDNGGEGDDVPLAEPITALVGTDAAAYLDDPQDGDFVFPGLAPGKYDIEVTPAAGHHVGVLPDLASNDPLTGLHVGSIATDVVIAPSTLVSGLDFGIQRNVAVPQANPDQARIGVGASEVVIPVLTDSTAVDPDAQVALHTQADTLEGDAATVTVPDGQTTSQVSVDADGQIVYTPNQALVDGCTADGGEACTEQFEYTLTDWLGQSDTGQLTITVQAAPVVSGGSATAALGGDVTFDAAPVTVGSISSATVAQAPEAGTVTAKADGTVVFRADDADAGDYAFTVRFTDDLGQSSTADYTVSVLDGPAVVGGSAVVPLGGGHTFDAAVVSETAIVSAEVVQPPAAGTATADSAGVVVYDAGTAAAGTYTFQVAFTDDLDQTSVATYTVTVQGTPTLTGGSATVPMTGSHTFAAAPVTTGEIASAVVSQAPSAGTVTVTVDGSVEFSAGDAAPGVYSFDVTMTDDLGQTGSAHYQVTVQAAPVVTGGTGRTGQQGTLTFDPAPVTTGSIATAAVGTQPAEGSVTVAADGAVTYRADGAAGGEYTFSVVYTDDLGQTGTATFTVTVQAAPTATGGAAVIAVGGSQTFAADPVTDGRIDAAAVSEAPAQGSATVDASGAVVYTAGDAAAGDHAFVVTFTDDLGQTGTARFVVTVQAAPVVTGGSVAIPLGGSHTFDAAPVTTGEIVSAVVSQAPAGGTVTVEPSGAVAFEAGDAPLGSYDFAVAFTDDLGQSVTAEFTVVVQDGPTAVGGTARIGQHDTVTFDAAPQTTGTIVRAEVGTAPAAGTVTVATDGTVVYTADGAAGGQYTFTVAFVDNSGQTAEVTFEVEVQAAPTVLDASVTTTVSSAAIIDLGAAFDGTAATLDRISAPENGTAELRSDGTVLYTPVAGYVGADAFTFTVVDDLGQTGTGTVSVRVDALDTSGTGDAGDGGGTGGSGGSGETNSPGTATPPVVVAQPGPAAPGAHAGPTWLPRTGAEVTGAALLALLLIGAGAGLIQNRRSRKHREG